EPGASGHGRWNRGGAPRSQTRRARTAPRAPRTLAPAALREGVKSPSELAGRRRYNRPFPPGVREETPSNARERSVPPKQALQSARFLPRFASHGGTGELEARSRYRDPSHGSRRISDTSDLLKMCWSARGIVVGTFPGINQGVWRRKGRRGEQIGRV